MTTMNIRLPDELRVCVDALVKSGEYQNNSDYVRDLIRTDLEQRAAAAQLRGDLERGFEGEGVVDGPGMWESFSDRVLSHLGKNDA